MIVPSSLLPKFNRKTRPYKWSFCFHCCNSLSVYLKNVREKTRVAFVLLHRAQMTLAPGIWHLLGQCSWAVEVRGATDHRGRAQRYHTDDMGVQRVRILYGKNMKMVKFTDQACMFAIDLT